MKKVLITGANGFIGHHLIKSAQDAGLKVYAGVRPSSNTESLKKLNIDIVPINYDVPTALKATLVEFGFNYIIHNAGTTQAQSSEEFFKVNSQITKNFVDALDGEDVVNEKFILMSSLAAQGPGEIGKSIHVNDVEKPITMYGESKLDAEKHLFASSKLNFTIFRPTAVYGPREKDLLILVKMLKKKLELYIGRKPQQLSFVYVEDLSNLVVASLNSEQSRKKYIVTDGNSYGRYKFPTIIKQLLQKTTVKLHVPFILINSVAKLLEFTGKFTKKTSAINTEKIKELTAENWGCDISNTVAELNYIPQYNLQAGLEKTIKWYQNNKWI